MFIVMRAIEHALPADGIVSATTCTGKALRSGVNRVVIGFLSFYCF